MEFLLNKDVFAKGNDVTFKEKAGGISYKTNSILYIYI